MLVCLLAGSATTVFVNARWFIADAYTRYAESQWRWPDARKSAREATVLALKLGPYNVRALQNQAVNDLFSGREEQALQEDEQALRFAPADAYLWRDHALALVYAGIFDGRLEHAVRQAQRQAPRSGPLHQSLALAGIKVYGQSNPRLQSLWLVSIRYVYALDAGSLGLPVYLAEQEMLLCDKVIPQSGHNPWCMQARWRHGLCPDAHRLEDCAVPDAGSVKRK
jgi:hypothetical protein